MRSPGLWIDTHCHLQLGDAGIEALNRAVDSGVQRVICVGTDAETSRQAVDIAVEAGQVVRSTVGLHPHDAKVGLADLITVLDAAIDLPDAPVVGIGECGLDYFYDHSPRKIQQQIFIEQIELAKKYDLALVVHTRDAWNDTFEILRSEGAPTRTVIHCFTGGPEEARRALDLGFYLSFSGIVTFPKSTNVLEAAQMCPIDRLLIETDSPFLSPVPFRGKPNEPARVSVIGEFLSGVKKVQVEGFAGAISENAEKVFNLQSL